MTVMHLKSPSSAVSQLWCPSSHLQVLYNECVAPQVTSKSCNMTVKPLKSPPQAVTWLWCPSNTDCNAPQVTFNCCILNVKLLKSPSSAVSGPVGSGVCGGSPVSPQSDQSWNIVPNSPYRIKKNASALIKWSIQRLQTPPYLCALLGSIQRTQTPSH